MKEFEAIQHLLNQKSQELNYLKQKAEQALKKTPPGKIVLSKSHGTVQYILKDEHTKGRGTYIEKKNTKLLSALLQKEYALSLSKEIQKQEKTIQALLKLLPNQELNNIYDNLHAAKKPYVTPYVLTDEQYKEKWLAVTFSGNPYPGEYPSLLTDRGDNVRSKSEKMLADKLYAMKIPYRYECPLYLRNAGTLYPDFTLLKTNTREEFYLEHMGMMDKPNYCEKALRKLQLYAKNGIYPGKNLLLTFETASLPLDMKQVEQMLQDFLFP